MTSKDLRHSGSSLRQVEYLARVEQPIELVQQLGALVAATLRIDKNENRLSLLGRNRLDDEDFASGPGVRWSETGHALGAATVRHAVDARSTAAAPTTVTLLHRRFTTTSY